MRAYLVAPSLALALLPRAGEAQWRGELAVAARAARPGGAAPAAEGASAAGAFAWEAFARGAWRIEVATEGRHDAAGAALGGSEARGLLRLGWSRSGRWGLALEGGAAHAWHPLVAPEQPAVTDSGSSTPPAGGGRRRAAGPLGGVLAWTRVRGMALSATARTTGAGARQEAFAEMRTRLADSSEQRQWWDSTAGSWRTDSISLGPMPQRFRYEGVRRVVLRQTDVALTASGDRGPFGFAIATGTRQMPGRTGVWASARGALVLRDGMGLTLQASQLPADLLRQLPARRELQLGVLLRPWRASAIPVSLPSGAAAATRSFVARRHGADSVTMVVDAPGARSVEVMGDFTAWRPVALVQRGQAWRLTMALAPGVHQLNLRVDGGEWGPPPGTTAADDGYGGRVGIVVIE